MKALATGDPCVPDRPSSFKGVCLASAGYAEARRAAPGTAASRLWGMTFRERYQGAERLQQELQPGDARADPHAGGCRAGVAFFELWPDSEAGFDELGTACERFDDHYFRGAASLPEERLVQRLRAGMEQGEQVRREELQPTPQGYRGGPRGWSCVPSSRDGCSPPRSRTPRRRRRRACSACSFPGPSHEPVADLSEAGDLGGAGHGVGEGQLLL